MLGGGQDGSFSGLKSNAEYRCSQLSVTSDGGEVGPAWANKSPGKGRKAVSGSEMFLVIVHSLPSACLRLMVSMLTAYALFS